MDNAHTWFDEQDIPAGASIPEAIGDGLDGSDVVLVGLSCAAVASGWVQDELDVEHPDHLARLEMLYRSLPELARRE